MRSHTQDFKTKIKNKKERKKKLPVLELYPLTFQIMILKEQKNDNEKRKCFSVTRFQCQAVC